MKAQNLKHYLYTIARRDIPIAQQSVQAAHAAVEYAYLFGRPSDQHPSIINLTIRDKLKLEGLRASLEEAGIRTSHFEEPYKDWGRTAIACMITEDQRHLLSHLQLWKVSEPYKDQGQHTLAEIAKQHTPQENDNVQS